MREVRLQTTGFGSVWSKQQRNQRTCSKCGSSNLVYPDKFTCECDDCGNREPRRLKKFKETKAKPLELNVNKKRELKVVFQKKQRGVIRGDRYISHRNKLHFCRKYVGFGISKEIFEHLEKNGVKEVVIIYTKVNGTQEVYYSDTQTWRNFGTYDRLGGFETQLFLQIKYMKLVGR